MRASGVEVLEDGSDELEQELGVAINKREHFLGHELVAPTKGAGRFSMALIPECRGNLPARS
jgi:hypothetical protein